MNKKKANKRTIKRIIIEMRIKSFMKEEVIIEEDIKEVDIEEVISRTIMIGINMTIVIREIRATTRNIK